MEDENTGVSCCMIVRDAMQHLPAALHSVREHVDEIVVVDTGSTDGTREHLEDALASGFIDVLRCIEWEGMSHARNVSLELATCSHIFILDSDEMLVEGGDLLREMASKHITASGVIVRNRMAGGSAWDTIEQTRFFVRAPDMRYEGKMHNQIDTAVKRRHTAGEAVVMSPEIVIEHYGYDLTEEERDQKYTMRLPIMKEMYEADDTRKNKSLHAYHYGVALMLLGKKAEGMRVLAEVRPEDVGYGGYQHALMLMVEGAQSTQNEPLLRQYGDALAECIEQGADPAPFARMYVGNALMNTQRVAAGLTYYAEAYLYACAPSMSRFEVSPDLAWENLAQMLRETGGTVDKETASSSRTRIAARVMGQYGYYDDTITFKRRLYASVHKKA